MKKPLVVKLDDEDRRRLDYVLQQTGFQATTLVRLLLRGASEGHLRSGVVQFNFPPYTEKKQ